MSLTYARATMDNVLDTELVREDDDAIDILIRWSGGEREAIRELIAELGEARLEAATLRAARA